MATKMADYLSDVTVEIEVSDLVYYKSMYSWSKTFLKNCEERGGSY